MFPDRSSGGGEFNDGLRKTILKLSLKEVGSRANKESVAAKATEKVEGKESIPSGVSVFQLPELSFLLAVPDQAAHENRN